MVLVSGELRDEQVRCRNRDGAAGAPMATIAVTHASIQETAFLACPGISWMPWLRDAHPAAKLRRTTRPFAKNIERVQGDERDAIMLAVGYGEAAAGRLRWRSAARASVVTAPSVTFSCTGCRPRLLSAQ